MSRPQIPRAVFPNVMQDLPQEFTDEVVNYLSSELFGKFAQAHVDKIKFEIAELDPEMFDKPEDFHQLAKDWRLLLRFWTDLLDLSKSKQRASAVETNNQE